MIWLAFGVIALFALCAWLAVWSRRDTHARWLAVAAFLIGLPTIAIAGVESLGRHKPLSLYWQLPEGEYVVLAYAFEEGVAIYAYIAFKDRIEPRPIVLPWSTETAEQMQKAQEGGGEGAKGKFLMLYEPSLDQREPVFHPLPQEALPDKTVPPRAPQYDADT